jgi:hypothetical protein
MPERRLKPPPLPSEVLAKVIRVGSIDGRLILWLSACFAIFAAAGHAGIPAIAGVAAAGAGAIELHGSTLLRQGFARGVDWLIRGQFVLLAVILFYSAYRIWSFDPQVLREQITPDIQRLLEQFGLNEDQFIEQSKVATLLIATATGFGSLIYQSLMVRYYASRRHMIEQALDHDRLAS